MRNPSPVRNGSVRRIWLDATPPHRHGAPPPMRFHRFFAVAVGVSVAFAARDALAVGQATGRVTGTVIEGQSKAPIPAALVTITGGAGVKKVVQTNEEGTF